MKDTYLLYIDVLGFKELSESHPRKVDDLYRIIASLNAHDHSAFSTIVFSDTILIHNNFDPLTCDQENYTVMYLAEFFKDLLHRTAGRGVSFRAVMLHGKFQHYLLNGLPYFYGPALIRAYLAEKSFPITGLLVDRYCSARSTVFSHRRYNADWNYVFVTQALDEWERFGGDISVAAELANSTDLGWFLGPELELLAHSQHLSKAHPVSEVRRKHLKTLRFYRSRYPRCFATMERRRFRMEDIGGTFDWQKVRKRMRESYRWGSQRRPPVPGSSGRKRT